MSHTREAANKQIDEKKFTHTKVFDTMFISKVCHVFSNNSDSKAEDRIPSLKTLVDELPQKIKLIYKTFHTNFLLHQNSADEETIIEILHLIHDSIKSILLVRLSHELQDKLDDSLSQILQIIAHYLTKNIFAPYHYLEIIIALSEWNIFSKKLREQSTEFTRRCGKYLPKNAKTPFSQCILINYLFLAKQVDLPTNEQKSHLLLWLKEINWSLSFEQIFEIVEALNSTIPYLIYDVSVFKKILDLISHCEPNKNISLFKFNQHINKIEKLIPFNKFCAIHETLIQKKRDIIIKNNDIGSTNRFVVYSSNNANPAKTTDLKEQQIKKSCLIL